MQEEKEKQKALGPFPAGHPVFDSIYSGILRYLLCDLVKVTQPL